MKKTTEQFTAEVKNLTGDEYTVLGEYFSSRTKIQIKHNICGNIYEIFPYSFLQGKRCPACFGTKKRTVEQFIEEAKKIHGNKYDYSKVNYINTNTKVEIICPKHGSFFPRASDFLRGSNCPKCSKEVQTKKKTTEQFIEEAKKIHGNKYNYSKVNYINSNTKVEIICPKHGSFFQTPKSHFKGCGCKICGKITGASKKYIGLEKLSKEAKKIHGNKYEYLNITGSGRQKKILIKCNACQNSFWQGSEDHLHGHGCPICAGTKKKTTEQFIEEAKKIHGNKYDYSKVNYINSNTKVEIICKKCKKHFLQTAIDHTQGYGCPFCNFSKGEKEIENFLIENKISYIPQKKFSNCKDKRPLPFDFYLPELNIAIEYNGKQHYKPIEKFGGEKQLHKQRHHDWIKRKYCQKNNITLVIISYNENIKSLLEKYLARSYYNYMNDLDFLIEVAKENNLEYFTNDYGDLEIKDKNLAFHLAKVSEYKGENDSVERWTAYYNEGKRCVFVYPPYLQNPNKVNVYKNILRYHCGIVDRRVYARKTKVVVYKALDMKPFFEHNNIEGYRNADKAYTLVDKETNEPLMCYSLGSAYFGKGCYDAEIARGACKLGIQVVGGASKLWKAIMDDNPKVNSIVYYVDRREYDGRSIGHLLDSENELGTVYQLKGCPSFLNYWKDDVYNADGTLWHRAGDYKNREASRNSDVVKAYHEGHAFEVKNPGSFTNIFVRKGFHLAEGTTKVIEDATGSIMTGSKFNLSPLPLDTPLPHLPFEEYGKLEIKKERPKRVSKPKEVKKEVRVEKFDNNNENKPINISAFAVGKEEIKVEKKEEIKVEKKAKTVKAVNTSRFVVKVETREVFNCIQSAADSLGILRTSISKAVNKNSKNRTEVYKSGDFSWVKLDEYLTNHPDKTFDLESMKVN